MPANPIFFLIVWKVQTVLAHCPKLIHLVLSGSRIRFPNLPWGSEDWGTINCRSNGRRRINFIPYWLDSGGYVLSLVCQSDSTLLRQFFATHWIIAKGLRLTCLLYVPWLYIVCSPHSLCHAAPVKYLLHRPLSVQPHCPEGQQVFQGETVQSHLLFVMSDADMILWLYAKGSYMFIHLVLKYLRT